MRFSALFNILLCSVLLFPAGVGDVRANTVSWPVTVAVPDAVNGQVDSNAVSVALPDAVNGQVDSNAVSVALPDAVNGQVDSMPASVAVNPENQGDPDVVGLWHMDGDWGDSSGNNLHGAPINGPVFNSDKKLGSNSGSFDGANEYIEIGDPANGGLDFGTINFSLEAWIKTSATGIYQDIVDKRVSTAGYFMGVGNDNKVHLYIRDTNNSAEILSSSIVTDGNWHHVVGVFERSGNASIYVDGMLDGTPASISGIGNINNSGKAAIAYRDPALTSAWTYFKGLIDEVAIYKRALTAEEIAFHANAIPGDPAAPPAPVLDPVPSVIGAVVTALSGTKTIGTSIWANNKKVAPLDNSERWQGTYETLQPGMNILNIVAVDAASKQSPPVSKSVIYDNMPPVIESSYPVNNSNTARPVTSVAINLTDIYSSINLDASRAGATIKNSNNQAVSGSWMNSGTKTIIFTPSATPLPSDTYLVTIYPVDGVENVGQQQIVFTTHDTSAPVTTLSVQETKGKDGWYSSTVTITLTASDGSEGSGIANTEYSFDGSSWSTYTAPFGLDADGVNTVYYRSADISGNVETTKSGEIKINKTGLVGLWHMDNDWQDSSIVGNHGTPYSGATFSSNAKIGTYAGSFTGSNSYVSIPDAPTLHADRNITALGWMYVNSLSNTWQNIFWKGNSPDCTTNCENREYGLWLNSAGYLYLTSTPEDRVGIGAFGVSVPAGSIKTAANTTTNNGWYHFAAVISSDQNMMKIYVNGMEAAGRSYSFTDLRDTSGPLQIGSKIGPADPFNGLIDEFTIYKLALSPTEILENYRSYSIEMPTVDPVQTPTTAATINLSGAKPANTALVVNGVTLVSLGTDTTWTGTYTLQPGMNNLSFTAMDVDGFHSQAVIVPVALDLSAPTVSSTDPVNNGLFNTSVGSIKFNLTDPFSIIDLEATLTGASVTKTSGADPSGSWTTSGEGSTAVITFTPAFSLDEGTYTAAINPTDLLGNRSPYSIIFTVDATPPSAPQINAILVPSRTTTKTITGTKSLDSTSVIVACSGATVGVVSYPTSLTWSVSVSGLHEGSNTIAAYAVDAAMNPSSSTQMTFTVDTLPPATPIANQPATPTKESFVTLTGTKVRDSYLFVNNVKTSAVYSDDTWSYTGNLASEGNNAFVLFAQDEAGNPSPSITVNVVRDTTAPRMTSNTPSINGVVNQFASIDITLVDDNAGVDLLESIKTNEVKHSNNTVISGTWTTQAGGHIIFTPAAGTVLSDGVYTVAIRPVDLLGNTMTQTFSFTLDTALPTAQTLTMNPTSPHKAETVRFSITFNEPMSTNIDPSVSFVRSSCLIFCTITPDWTGKSWSNYNKTWNGSHTFSSGTGDGAYTVNVSGAQDIAGNAMTSAATGAFVLDTTPPASPGLDNVTTPTNVGNQLIRGGREAGTAIYINGTKRVDPDLNPAATETWTYSYPLSEGTNTLSITARDAAGNDSLPTTTTLVLDSTAPAFTVIYTNPSSTATQTLTGTKEPGCIVKLGNTQLFGPADTSDTWSYEVSLISGITNHLVFTAADALGNTTSKTVDILYDNASPAQLGPGVLIADGSGKGTEINLTWTAYPETADIGYYAVYRSLSSFSDVTGTGIALVGTVNKGIRSYKVTGLTLGTTYFFAVVPVDQAGNKINTVNPASATPTDTLASEEVTNLVATAGYTGAQGNFITLTWTPSVNSVGDLADQVLYIDSGTGYDAGTPLGKTATTSTKTGLVDATKYKFKIKVKDTLGHESDGAIVEAMTRLANPLNLAAVTTNGKAALSWSAVSSSYSSYVKQYNIYRATSTAQLTSIGTMTHIGNVAKTATTYNDTGLTNDTTYQYAVTVLNTSGAERSDIQSISATPQADSTGPVIDTFTIVAGQVVTAPITITATALDAESTMGSMELSVDGIVVATQAGSSLSFFWNVVEKTATDGNHTITLKALDSKGNATEDPRQVIVSLAQPAAPRITNLPSQTTSTTLSTVTGTAPLFTTVTLKVNGTVVGQTPSTGTTGIGAFSFSNVALVEGDNALAVKAGHRGGESAYSDYKITVDTGAPPAPKNLVGQVLAGGLIRFTWANATGENPTGYNLYRGTSAFTTSAGATRTNATPITYQFKEENPGDDGLKYYAVTALDSAGNESAISNVISLTSDRLYPSVASIQYIMTPAPDPAAPAQTTGLGTVRVILTVSELLKELPFLSFEPASGSPIVLTMKKTDDTHYEGTMAITADMPHGPTTYKFSGKDMAGNRGNAQGAGLTIDVNGPTASIQTPRTVLQIAATPTLVGVVFDEPVAGTPVMALKASDNTTALISSLTTTDNGIHWTGSVDTSALSAGQAEFMLTEAKDIFDNTGATVTTGKTVLLYTDTVPPPGIPQNLTAKPEKGGKITLGWQPVVYPGIDTATVSYNLYRRAEVESTATRIQTGIISSQTTTIVAQDTPDQEGLYHYTVTSVGLVGSESLATGEVQAMSDRTGPGAPASLSLSLTGNGVAANWAAPSGETAATYRLYRSNSPITGTAGLTLVATAAAVTATDAGPAKAYPYYAVASVDALGNEGDLSESAHITFLVPPVRNLTLTRIEQTAPQLAWDAPADGSVVGYYLYRNDSRIIETPITDRAYTDGYYAGGGVTYAVTAVTAVNGAEIESPKKIVTLPELGMGLKDGTTLRRGLLETATIIITNSTSAAVTIDTLDIKIGDAPLSTLQGPLDIAGNGQLQAEKVLATLANAPSTVGALITATWSPAPGTTVKVYKTTAVSVAGASTAFEIYSDPLVRGATARITLKVNNVGTAQMEFPTSENGGATGKVKINLKDEDGNILATGMLNQRTGPVVNIGTAAVARINPDESFTSEPITFTVPSSAPYNVTIEAVIANTYYHYAKPDQVTAPGMTQSQETTISETSYRAVAAPEQSFYVSAQPVVITGRAISNQPGNTEILMPFVPVKIGISTKGFDKYDTVTTDSQGNFSYTYTPASNEAGTYQVWAVHPDISTKTIQAVFTIAGLQATPTLANWRMVKNTSIDVPITLTNTGSTQLVNLQFVVQKSQGVSAGVINSGGTALAPGQTRTVTLRISADATAPDTGFVTLTTTLNPDGQTGEITGRTDINLSMVTSIPIIATSPSYIDAGMVRADQKIVQFTITNSGAGTLTNAKLSGPSTSWMTLTSSDAIAEIKPGESQTIGILLRPPDTLAQGVYDDQIVITSDNHIPYTYHIKVTVTSSAVGNVLFDVLDQLMQRVDNATITFQHQTLTELLYTVKTGTNGTVMQYDIPEGRYVYNISAPGRKSSSGSFIVYPGITTSVPIGLEVTLVQVEWSVTPVELQDRYEITVTQTFATNVPAPVLVTDPPSTNLPEMQPGQVFNGEFTVTNYGLIAVNNVKIDFPASFLDYDIEVLTTNVPNQIAAQQRVTFQYRITKRMATASGQEFGVGSQYAFNSELGTQNSELFNEVKGYGSSCVAAFSMDVGGTAVMCPSTPQQSTVNVNTSANVGIPISCPGNGALGGTGSNVYYGEPGNNDGQGSGGGGMNAGFPTLLGGGGGSSCGDTDIPDSDNGPTVCTQSMVKMNSGTYEDGVTDIEVKTNGFPVAFERYYTSRWKEIGKPPLERLSASSGGSGGGGGVRSNHVASIEAVPAQTPKLPPAQAYGWTSPWFAKIEPVGNGVRYFDGYGRVVYFIRQGAGILLNLNGDPVGAYTAGPGAEQYVAENGLQVMADATGFHVWDKSGLRKDFNQKATVTAGQVSKIWYLLTSMEYGHVTSSVYGAGNKAHVNYDAYYKPVSVIDATGTVALRFIYNDNGYITRVEDRDGRGVDYTVDERGALTEAHVPVAGTATETTPKSTYEYDQVNGSFRLLRKTDSEGRVTSIGYNAGALDVASVTEPSGATRSFSYNFPGYTFYYTDTRGNQTTYIVNTAGKIVFQSKAGHVIMKTDYLAGRVEKTTDELGNVTQITKNERYDPISVIDAKGNETRIAYNQYWKVASITDPMGNVTTFDYNEFEELTSVTYPDGSRTVVERDNMGNITSLTKGTGDEAATTRYEEYDGRGNPHRIVNPEGDATLLGYDQYGHVNSVTDPDGNVTTITNDILGQPLTVQDPRGNTKNYTYDTKGNVLSMTDENLKTTAYTYDFKHRVTSVTDAAGIVTKYVYDGEGSPTEIREAFGTPNERLTKITYDALNRKETVTDPLNNVTRYEYQGSTTGCTTCTGGSTEQPAKITDPLGNSTNLTFDENGRITGVRDPLNNITSIQYDSAGRVTGRTDANNNGTSYEYDAAGRVTKQTDANGGEIIFTYDSRGNLRSLKDQKNQTTTFEYDKVDRKVREIRPMGQIVEYTYYPSGLLHTIKNAKDQISTYTYDTANRLTGIAYSDGKTDTIGYDAANNMTSYGNEVVTGTIVYDNLNRKTSETVNYGTFSKTYGYTYNAHGNKVAYTSPEGVTYTYDYNKNGQPTSMMFGTKTIGFDYVWQQQRKTTLPNGVATDYGYNAASWLEGITMKKDTSTLASSAYGFDKVGNITSRTTEQGSHAYGYDSLYQLTQATNPTLPAEAYTYDSVGNRQTSTSGVQSISYSHNANNELISYGTATVGYDANGNTIQETNNGLVTKYLYNANDRLERVELPDGRTAIYRYDPFGRRISKTIGAVVTYFVYADEGLIAEYDASGALQKAYGWMPGGIWGTHPVFMVENGQYYYYHNDHLATPQKMTDSSGAVVWSADYKPFGEATITVSTITNNLRFPGQYYDAETGLSYNYFRDYNAAIGRYIEKDPLGLREGINLYSYVEDNSVNWVDPFGLVRWGAMGNASLGLLGNGLGVVVGGALVGSPDVTGVTKVVGYITLTKSVAGWGLSWYNFTRSFSNSASCDAPSSATRAVAAIVAPNNLNSDRFADVADLTIDLASGRGRIYPYGKTFSSVFTTGFDPTNIMFTNPSLVNTFQATQVLQVGLDDVTGARK